MLVAHLIQEDSCLAHSRGRLMTAVLRQGPVYGAEHMCLEMGHDNTLWTLAFASHVDDRAARHMVPIVPRPSMLQVNMFEIS